MEISKIRIKVVGYLSFQELKNSTKILKIFVIILFKRLSVLIPIAFAFSKNLLPNLLFQSRVKSYEENKGTVHGKLVKYECSL